MNAFKETVAREDCGLRTLEQALVGADVFIGVSVGNALKKEWVAQMAACPVIFALANPTPEIHLDELKQVRDKFI